MTAITSLTLCARVTLDMHSLNNEGVEGNQQMTRMVHVIDGNGQHKVVNAVSGDMLKHIFVEHATPLLDQANQKVCENAKRLHPDRILLDAAFQAKSKSKGISNSEILTYMLQNCAVTDLAGTLFAEKAAARKSCVEFAWMVGLPDSTVTEQYFHVKYAPDRGKAAGGESVEDKQAIFHRPASSGIYALVCTLDLYRIGLNDITRVHDVAQPDRTVRCKAAVNALAASLLKPSGAQRNTQAPHVLDCEGVIAWSLTSLPAPAMSPLKDGYEAQIAGCVNAMNSVAADGMHFSGFKSMAAGLDTLTELATDLTAPDPPVTRNR